MAFGIGKMAHVPGIFEKPPAPLTFFAWQKQLCDDWFATDAAFQAHIIHRKLIMPTSFADSLTVRAVAIFVRFGVVAYPDRCPQCKGEVKLERREKECGGYQYNWSCRTMGHNHLHQAVNSTGFLTNVSISKWMPFLHFTNHLRLGSKMANICKDLSVGYGNISPSTFLIWRRLYQSTLGIGLVYMGLDFVGNENVYVVVDESVVGVFDDGWSFESAGISKRGAKPRKQPKSRTKKLVRKGVLKRHPARTFYTKTQKVQKNSFMLKQRPAGTIKKKPAAKAANKKPAANLKNAGRWLWLAIAVGKGDEVYTHENHKKKVAFRLLPRASEAQEGKPRGLKEIKDTLQGAVRKKSILVYDGWTSTDAAVKELGYRHPPAIKHEDGWRDTETGFHTNDAESENNRVKGWSRHRYGRLSITELDMQEYVFYVNGGSDISLVMKGLAYGSDAGYFRNKII